MIKTRNRLLADRVIKGLESRNMCGYYAETKEESHLISEYINSMKGQAKFKRIVQKGLGR